MLVSPARLSLLFLSVFPIVTAQLRYQDFPSSLPHLSARPSYPRDVVGNWTFTYSENDTLCPRSIQHLGFFRVKKGPIRIFHHRIIQDGIRCKNNRGVKGRRFRLFPSKVVKAAFRNRTTPFRIPPRLLKLIRISGPARRAFRAANMHGEGYFIGYESKTRKCGDDRAFRKGTTAFLFRPDKKQLAIKGLGVTLTPGKRYLVMIPLFKGISCVYSSELREPGVNQTTAEGEEDKLGEDPGNELEAKEDDRACFPASASIRVADGRNITMKDMSIGDAVQVGANEYAPVFMFTHRMQSVVSNFRRIELDSGAKLDVTSGHYVWANGKLVAAGEVKIGDVMPLGDGSYARVQSLSTVSRIGLYNPQTTHGDIIVNGVRVSTYTQAVKPEIAHTMLTPLRAAFTFFNIDLSFGCLDQGSRSLPSFGLVRR